MSLLGKLSAGERAGLEKKWGSDESGVCQLARVSDECGVVRHAEVSVVLKIWKKTQERMLVQYQTFLVRKCVIGSLLCEFQCQLGSSAAFEDEKEGREDAAISDERFM